MMNIDSLFKKISSRRKVITGSFATLLGFFTLPGFLKAYVWKEIYDTERSGGIAEVIDLQGKAYIGGVAIKKNTKLRTDFRLIVPSKSQLTILLPDFSLLQIKGEAKINFELGGNTSCLYSPDEGALTFIIRKGSPMYHLLQGKNSNIGIREGVCHYRVVSETLPLFNNKNTPVTVPEKCEEYLCLCHGSLDYIEKNFNRVFKIDYHQYHRSYFLIPTLNGFVMEDAPLLDHNDQEIYNAINLFSKPIYPIDWLKIPL